MVTFLSHLIDRCLFTVMFILGIQLPAFIMQYIQQLSGHLHESQRQLTQYQAIADLHFNGSLLQLTQHYQKNSDPVIVETGQVIDHLLQRVDYLATHLSALVNQQYIDQLWFMAQHLDVEIAKQTQQYFTFAVPLTIEALSTGFIVALLTLSSIQLCVFSCKYCLKLATRKKQSPLI